MTVRLFLILWLLLGGGCAHRDVAPPTCDGAGRRPANPHGSVLDGTAVQPSADPDPVPAGPTGGGCA